jgi:hypothetical protein
VVVELDGARIIVALVAQPNVVAFVLTDKGPVCQALAMGCTSSAGERP